jgi:hypothetical protein
MKEWEKGRRGEGEKGNTFVSDFLSPTLPLPLSPTLPFFASS